MAGTFKNASGAEFMLGGGITPWGQNPAPSMTPGGMMPGAMPQQLGGIRAGGAVGQQSIGAQSYNVGGGGVGVGMPAGPPGRQRGMQRRRGAAVPQQAMRGLHAAVQGGGR